MLKQSTIILYHGTDLESAEYILNNGLDIDRLIHVQAGRITQLGLGWYTTEDIGAAWYFASIAQDALTYRYAVIEMEMFQEHLESLLEQGLASKSQIINVSFQGEQYWFHPDSFAFLNQQAIFRPYQGDE